MGLRATTLVLSALCALPSAAAVQPVADLSERVAQLELQNAALAKENARIEAKLEGLEASLRSRSGAIEPISAPAGQPTPVAVVSHGDDNPGFRATVASPPRSSWNGPYAGVSAGFETARATGFNDTGSVIDPTSQRLSGGRGAVQIGENLQLGRVVVGAELAANFGALSRRVSASGPVTLSRSCFKDPFNNYILESGGYATKVDCAAHQNGALDLTGRLGYTFNGGKLLLYGKAGFSRSTLAVGYESSNTYPGYPQFSTTPTVFQAGGRRALIGDVVGGGLEYKINNILSAGVEYRYIYYAPQRFYSFYNYSIPPNTPNGPTGSSGNELLLTPNSNDLSSQTISVFLNLHFGN